MMSFIPLVIIVIIIIAIVRMTKNNGRKNTLFGKQIRWIFGGYLAILVICAGLSPLLPNEGEIYKMTDVNDLDQAGASYRRQHLRGILIKWTVTISKRHGIWIIKINNLL